MKKTRLLSMFIAVMMVLLITSSAMAETIVISGAGPDWRRGAVRHLR